VIRFRCLGIVPFPRDSFIAILISHYLDKQAPVIVSPAAPPIVPLELTLALLYRRRRPNRLVPSATVYRLVAEVGIEKLAGLARGLTAPLCLARNNHVTAYRSAITAADPGR
jgi:hypothetical protein